MTKNKETHRDASQRQSLLHQPFLPSFADFYSHKSETSARSSCLVVDESDTIDLSKLAEELGDISLGRLLRQTEQAKHQRRSVVLLTADAGRSAHKHIRLQTIQNNRTYVSIVTGAVIASIRDPLRRGRLPKAIRFQSGTALIAFICHRLHPLHLFEGQSVAGRLSPCGGAAASASVSMVRFRCGTLCSPFALRIDRPSSRLLPSIPSFIPPASLDSIPACICLQSLVLAHGVSLCGSGVWEWSLTFEGRTAAEGDRRGGNRDRRRRHRNEGSRAAEIGRHGRASGRDRGIDCGCERDGRAAIDCDCASSGAIDRGRAIGCGCGCDGGEAIESESETESDDDGEEIWKAKRTYQQRWSSRKPMRAHDKRQ